MANQKPIVLVSGGFAQIADTDFVNPGAGVQFPNGSASAPSCALNTTSGFFWDTTNSGIGGSLGGAQQWFWNATAFRQSIAGGGNSLFTCVGEGGTAFQSYRLSNDASGANYTMGHGRGTIASPAVPVLNDVLGSLTIRGWTSAPLTFTVGATVSGILIETGTVSATAMGTRIIFSACAIGSGSVTEITRYDVANGFSMFGANIVVDANRILRTRSYTVATVPAITTTGIIYVSDDGGGGVQAFSDGSNWRRVTDRLVVSTGNSATSGQYANPSASIGLTTVNGSATTSMRSDAAPALSQAISPTWSGAHTFSNPIVGAIGSTSLPGYTFSGATGDGFSRTAANRVSLSLGGTEWFRFTLNANSVSRIAIGNTIDDTISPNAPLISIMTGGLSNNAVFIGEGNTQLSFQRLSANSGAAGVVFQKGRGTVASPGKIALNDTMGMISFSGDDTTGTASFTVGATISGTLIETGTVSSTAMGSDMRFSAAAIGSGSVTEIVRLATATGLSMFGANPVIDANRLLLLRNFTVATLPAAPAVGATAFVTDATLTIITGLGLAPIGGGANKVPCYYDGAWKIG